MTDAISQAVAEVAAVLRARAGLALAGRTDIEANIRKAMAGTAPAAHHPGWPAPPSCRTARSP